jgi:hypothetical protein
MSIIGLVTSLEELEYVARELLRGLEEEARAASGYILANASGRRPATRWEYHG